MSHDITEFHTWKCDIPDCKEKLTAGGDHLYAVQKGWGQIEIKSFGMAGDRPGFFPETKFVLCPDHTDQLKGFFFDDENRTADHSAE